MRRRTFRSIYDAACVAALCVCVAWVATQRVCVCRVGCNLCIAASVYVTRRVCYHSVCALVGGCQCGWSLCQAVGEELAQRSPRRCTVFTSHCTLMALQVTCPCAAVHQSAELVVHITEHCSHHQLANAGEKNTQHTAHSTGNRRQHRQQRHQCRQQASRSMGGNSPLFRL